MKQLVGKRFETDADLKQSVTSWPQTLDTDFLCAGMQTYVSASVRCLSVVTTWRSDMYHVLPMCHVYIEVGTRFSACECLLPYFLKTPL
jgi:hypothetical protein